VKVVERLDLRRKEDFVWKDALAILRKSALLVAFLVKIGRDFVGFSWKKDKFVGNLRLGRGRSRVSGCSAGVFGLSRKLDFVRTTLQQAVSPSSFFSKADFPVVFAHTVSSTLGKT
jgi:hypothetical protein